MSHKEPSGKAKSPKVSIFMENLLQSQRDSYFLWHDCEKKNAGWILNIIRRNEMMKRISQRYRLKIMLKSMIH